MLFPTATFAIFFIVVLPLSWLLMPRGERWRPFMIVASFVFYAGWDWRFCFLLAFSIVCITVIYLRFARPDMQRAFKTPLFPFTPILGAVFGETQGIAPGFKASAAYGIVDFYVEAEVLRDSKVRDDSFTYAWSELGFSPAKWLRFGIVGQRTRAYQSDRDIQRGGFAQFISGKVTLGLYVFNPDDSADRVAILSLGADF